MKKETHLHRTHAIREPVDVAALVTNIHRGVHVDVEGLNADEKKELLKLLDAHSESDRVYKDPALEASRERVREQLR